MLRCIIGQLQCMQGTIEIAASSDRAKVFGYMPQEVALISEFTGEEMITYFGKLYGIHSEKIKARIIFLTGFLNIIAESQKLICKLSGGQKRRISLACAMIHSPSILILDEPTVGLDPLLRKRIWQYLVRLTYENVTIIITTHYIEEAKLANTIAFMRNGEILAEDKPSSLLEKHNLNSLEDILIKICEEKCNQNGIDADGEKINDSKELKRDSKAISVFKNKLWQRGSNDKKSKKNNNSSISKTKNYAIFADHLVALIWKNVTRMRRNVAILLFQCFLSSFQTLLLCTCIGKDPVHMPVAIFNEDFGNFYIELFTTSIEPQRIALKYVGSLDEAINSVKNGANLAAIVITANETEAEDEKAIKVYSSLTPPDSPSTGLTPLKMHVYLDMSNRITG